MQHRFPKSAEKLLDLETWLDPESADALAASIADMRQNGTAFNIGVRTLANDLVEADGRVAGGLATLRLRPLAGERKKMSELAYDARRLGKQVERLSGMLDAAPLPVWLERLRAQADLGQPAPISRRSRRRM